MAPHPHILQAQGGVSLKLNDIDQAIVFLEQAWKEDDSLRVAGNNLIQAYRQKTKISQVLSI